MLGCRNTDLTVRRMPCSSARPLHRLAFLVGCLLLLILPAGCVDAPRDTPSVSVAEALAFESVGRGQQAQLDTTQIAIRDAAAWAAYQDSLRPLVPFGPVDFPREMVLLAAVPTPSGGYSIHFEAIEKTDEGLTAHYRLSIPADDCIPTMGTAVPFEAVRLAHVDAPVRFEHETEAYRCTQR